MIKGVNVTPKTPREEDLLANTLSRLDQSFKAAEANLKALLDTEGGNTKYKSDATALERINDQIFETNVKLADARKEV